MINNYCIHQFHIANTLLLCEEVFVFATFSANHLDCITASKLTCFQSMKSDIKKPREVNENNIIIVLQQSTCSNLSPVPASMIDSCIDNVPFLFSAILYNVTVILCMNISVSFPKILPSNGDVSAM